METVHRLEEAVEAAAAAEQAEKRGSVDGGDDEERPKRHINNQELKKIVRNLNQKLSQTRIKREDVAHTKMASMLINSYPRERKSPYTYRHIRPFA